MESVSHDTSWVLTCHGDQRETQKTRDAHLAWHRRGTFTLNPALQAQSSSCPAWYDGAVLSQILRTNEERPLIRAVMDSSTLPAGIFTALLLSQTQSHFGQAAA